MQAPGWHLEIPHTLHDESAVGGPRLPNILPAKRPIDLTIDFLTRLWNQITRDIGAAAAAALNTAEVWLTVPAAWFEIFTCFNLKDPCDSTVGLINGQLDTVQFTMKTSLLLCHRSDTATSRSAAQYVLPKRSVVSMDLSEVVHYEDSSFIATLYTSDSGKFMRYTDEDGILELCKRTIDLTSAFQQNATTSNMAGSIPSLSLGVGWREGYHGQVGDRYFSVSSLPFVPELDVMADCFVYRVTFDFCG
ncbi:hypothetical protein EST38_g12214 [Candolleomyces aberdarensis]|uniref:Uncharacterized protein n=1 Tax=Candolleomyces aberdarensis TaxID=2316362 RepID=A0A4Q2D2Z1_9AGAR|nr:hypothetical protein EST38_g12214 [Candolleomyces aberdarensis]